jgi:hypothetical protein
LWMLSFPGGAQTVEGVRGFRVWLASVARELVAMRSGREQLKNVRRREEDAGKYAVIKGQSRRDQGMGVGKDGGEEMNLQI